MVPLNSSLRQWGTALRFELLPDRRRLRRDEVVFAIPVSLGVLLVDGDDLMALGDEVAVRRAEPVDGIAQAKPAVFDERAALADVAALQKMGGDLLGAGAAPSVGVHFHCSMRWRSQPKRNACWLVLASARVM